MATEQNTANEVVVVRNVLGYELDYKQNFVSYHLLPAVVGCLFYIIHFACDVAVVYRHYREDNPVWAALTIFFMYLPALGCYILTISSSDLWPEFDSCGCVNIKWFFMKTAQHIFFPVWSMWRYAERLFWSIEGIRSSDEDETKHIMETLNSPRTIELYYFLQGYLQATPQILFQLHIIMRHARYLDLLTVDAQVLGILMSLVQMAKTTTLYQRYKTQNIGGKYYPWFKPYRSYHRSAVDSSLQHRVITYRCKNEKTQRTKVNDAKSESLIDTQQDNVILRQREHTDSQSSRDLEKRRSSDFYEQPTNSYLEGLAQEGTSELGRETSVVDGPERLILKDTDITQMDFFHPKRLLEIKSLPEDDPVGKMISILWWFCFLLARVLAISSFAYIYPTEIIWLLSGHFILVVSLLLYDVRTDETMRAKAVFFVFIGWVYLFCLIEFKIKFKKTRFIYILFFSLMFFENFLMVFMWWCRDMENILNDWWCNYIFYMILGCSILSMLSMLLYVKILKPKKVVIDVVEVK